MYRLSDDFSLEAKLSSAFSYSFLGKNLGLGDLFLARVYQITTHHNLKIIVGIKIPLNNADSKNNDKQTLPMDYQTSLGIYGMIAGIKMSLSKHWNLSVATQIP